MRLFSSAYADDMLLAVVKVKRYGVTHSARRMMRGGERLAVYQPTPAA